MICLRSIISVLVVMFMSGLIISCSDSDGHDAPPPHNPIPMTEAYDVTVTNLTAGQPLSPIAVILHNANYSVFTINTAAPIELEVLAEGGDNTSLLASADASDNVYDTTAGMAPLAPGASETFSVQTDEGINDNLQLSLISMLVNTNDGITAINQLTIGALEVGEQMTVTGSSYDSGTEANTETADTMPGPAAVGGTQEGFNATRDDVANVVLSHSGVVTHDDGLAGSALTVMHRWDNPVIRVSITRTQ